MRNPRGYRSFQQFRREMLNQGPGSLSSSVEDIADDIFRSQVSEENESLWDPIDEDDD